MLILALLSCIAPCDRNPAPYFYKGFSKKDAYRIETIVDELCNNAIEHGSMDVKSKTTLKCSFDKHKLDLTIIDSGNPHFDASHVERLSEKVRLDTSVSSATRGRGLPIVSMLADKVTFSVQDGGTAVHVQKYKKNPNEEEIDEF